MIHHAVYFWLKPELNPTEVAAFQAALLKVTQLEAVQMGFIGSPANTTKRPQVEDTYDFGLVVYFEDLQAHDRYQIDPGHKNFIADNSKFWTRVQVLDIETINS